MNKKKVLFICSHNSSRSQMAECIANALYGDKVIALSGGVTPHPINPRAIKVLAEKNISVLGHYPKSYTEFEEQAFDMVISLCDEADKVLPRRFGITRRTHLSFPNPTRCNGCEDEKDQVFRQLRDDLEKMIARIVS